MISIKGLSRAEVLAALYNYAKPQGMGFMAYDPRPMTTAEAEELLQDSSWFDYLRGRVMKVDLKSDEEFNERGYDRDNGAGTAQAVIDLLRGEKDINPPEAEAAHLKGLIEAADAARKLMGERTTTTVGKGATTVRLGLADVADVLGPKVDAAVAAHDDER